MARTRRRERIDAVDRSFLRAKLARSPYGLGAFCYEKVSIWLSPQSGTGSSKWRRTGVGSCGVYGLIAGAAAAGELEAFEILEP